MRSTSLALLLCALTLSGCDNAGENKAAKAEAAPVPTAAPATEVPNTAAPVTDASTTKLAPKFQVVNVAPGGDLPALLAEHAALARQARMAPFVELWADWCGPCKALEASMADPRIVQAFAGIYLIRLDSDAWGSKLAGTGLDNSAIPVFFELDAQGKTTGRKIDGGAWGEDLPENMAPPLDAFFHSEPS